MVDLSVSYLGLPLKNPLVAAASPLSRKVDSVKKLEEAGIGAVVMYSLFEEQIEHDSKALNYFLERGTESNPEATSYFPDLPDYHAGPEDYLKLIGEHKKAVNIPVIASLNGVATGGWVKTAKRMEEAGADALELNIYFVSTSTQTTSEELENAYVELVSDVRASVSIPLAVKLSPFFTSLPNLAARLVGAGAKGLVFFNRFIQPDLNIENMEVEPALELSTSSELLLPLRWIAMLYSHINTDFALTSGVHRVEDVVKAVMAGAGVVQLASELVEHGPERATELLADMQDWMKEHEYDSVRQMCGSMSAQHVAEPDAFERANYMKTLLKYDLTQSGL